MWATRNQEEFLRLVEDGEERVYPEDSTNSIGKAFIPAIVGSALMFVFLFVLTDISIHVSPLVYLILSISPIVFGFLITILSLSKITASDKQYAARGLTRRQLSQAIYFLDMLLDGRADNGILFKKPDPEEYRITPTIAFGSTIHVLKKLGDDTAKIWLASLREKLNPEISLKTKIFLGVTISGTILAIPVAVILEIVRMTGWVSTAIILPLMAVILIILVFLVGGLTVYAIKSSKSAAPLGVLAAIAEPQIRFETDRALEKVLEMFKTEGQYPLRVLVSGTYDVFKYTNRSYSTSEGVELRAAVLFPG